MGDVLKQSKLFCSTDSLGLENELGNKVCSVLYTEDAEMRSSTLQTAAKA